MEKELNKDIETEIAVEEYKNKNTDTIVKELSNECKFPLELKDVSLESLNFKEKVEFKKALNRGLFDLEKDISKNLKQKNKINRAIKENNLIRVLNAFDYVTIVTSINIYKEMINKLEILINEEL